jgi:hypothetical protein
LGELGDSNQNKQEGKERCGGCNYVFHGVAYLVWLTFGSQYSTCCESTLMSFAYNGRIMLKRLAFVVFLTVVPPISGQQQSPEPNGNQKNTQSTPQPSHQPARVVTCEVKQDDTTIESQWPESVPKGYFHTLISAKNLPNLLLFLVGLAGIGVAIVTLLTIKRQVDTFVSKERARLTVDIDSFQPPRKIYDHSDMPPSASEVWFAKLKIANHGSTNAFIGPALCLACVENPGWDARKTAITSQIPLPKVIPPDGKAIEFDIRIETDKMNEWKVYRDTIDAVGNRSKRIYVIGLIEFWDVFDTHWSLKFFRQWEGTGSAGAWQFTSWRDYGPDDGGPIDGNREFRIEKPSKFRRIWRSFRKRDPDQPVVTIMD